jgi:hypothetical protein
MMSDPLDTIKKAGGIEEPRAHPRSKNRDGMRGLLTYHHPEVIKQLKRIALDQDKNQQQLMTEALNMLFSKYGKPTIA